MKLRTFCIPLILIGFLIYFPSLFKGFKQDDIPQIVHFLPVHSLKNIPLFFTSGFGYPRSQINLFHFYYKPIMFTFFSFLYTLGSGVPLPFHLLQLLLYIANSLLLFYFFSKIWNKKLAFILALLFLLFPGSVEVESYVANLQDVLFFFFGMACLCITQVEKLYKTKSIFIGFFLLFSVLSKETGVIFLFLIPFYSFLFQKKFFKYTIFSSITVSLIYIFLRAVSVKHITLYLLNNAVQHFNLAERIPLAISVIGFYIQELIIPTVKFPKYLVTGKIPALQIIAYSIIDLVALIAFFLFLNLLKKKKKELKYLWFFGAWLFFGIIFHSQLFFNLDILATTRWLYFPLAGFLGIIGTILSPHAFHNLIKKRIFVLGFFLLFCIYLSETIYSILFIQ